LRRPAETAPGESDDADDDQNDADYDGGFHWCELTMTGDPGSN
jgi:hypothetical protein